MGHVHIHFLLRMTDTLTSQNIDLSSWDTRYNFYFVGPVVEEEDKGLVRPFTTET